MVRYQPSLFKLLFKFWWVNVEPNNNDDETNRALYVAEGYQKYGESPWYPCHIRAEILYRGLSGRDWLTENLDVIKHFIFFHLRVMKQHRSFFSFCWQVDEEKYIIWAYGNEDIRNAGDFDRHASRGVGGMQLVIVDKQPVPTQAAPVALLHSRITAILIAVATIFLNVLVM